MVLTDPDGHYARLCLGKCKIALSLFDKCEGSRDHNADRNHGSHDTSESSYVRNDPAAEQG
jgi:hypothetical protein